MKPYRIQKEWTYHIGYIHSFICLEREERMKNYKELYRGENVIDKVFSLSDSSIINCYG